MNNRFDAKTDLHVSYDSTPEFTGTTETDIIYQEGMVLEGKVGMYWCNDNTPAGRYVCDQGYVRVRGAGKYNRGLACHETGHAVGLLHGANADPKTSNSAGVLYCLRDPEPADSPLGENQVDRINEMY